MKITILQTAAQNDSVSSAVNGMLGGWLDRFISKVEGQIWASDATGAWDDLLDTGLALAAVFSIILAANMAYKMMTEGEGIKVLKLMRPLAIAFVLANWYFVTTGITGIIKPIENRARNMYVQNNAKLNHLKHVRDSVDRKLTGKVSLFLAQAEYSKMLQESVENTPEKEGNERAAGDGVENNMGDKYANVLFGDVITDLGMVEYDEHGNALMPVDMADHAERAFQASWLEDTILWIGEVWWTVWLYFIFLIQYLFLFVLVVFGPIWMACSLLEIWEDAWSDWLGKYITVSLYGTCGYLALSFGLMIITYSINRDIGVLMDTYANKQTFIAYVKNMGNVNFYDLTSIGMYLVALIVSSVTIKAFSAMAGIVTPGDNARKSGNIFRDMVDFVNKKEEQGKELAKEAAAAAVTAGAASAMAAESKAMEKVLDEEMKKIFSEDKPKEPENGTGIPVTETSEEKKTEKTEEERRKEEARKADDKWSRTARKMEEKEKEKPSIKSKDPVKVMEAVTEAAYREADRKSYMAHAGAAYIPVIEDLAASVRDKSVEEEIKAEGYENEYRSLKEERERENSLLLKMVVEGVGSMTAMQTGGRFLGFGVDMTQKEVVDFLKKHGLYKSALKIMFLNHMARSTMIQKKGKDGQTVYMWRNNRQKRKYEKFIAERNKWQGLVNTKCRNILAERDIHIDGNGAIIKMAGGVYGDYYWRKGLGLNEWELIRKKGYNFNDEELDWFLDTYNRKEKAEELLMQLDVMRIKAEIGELEDFVIERQLLAESDRERGMWKMMAADAEIYYKVRKQTENILAYHKKKNNKNT